MLNTTLLYSTHSCVKKACTHPSKWTRKYCHTITSRVDDVYTSYTPRNHSIQDYPHFPKKFIQNIQIWQPNSPYIYIYIYMASEVPWTPSILREPTNKKVLRHMTPSRVATSKSGLQSLDTIRLWEVMIKNTKKNFKKKKKKKDFYYTLGRSGLSFITD
jgi:hypothetical protein